MNRTLFLICSLVATALCGCLNDWDTGHSSSDYSTRLYSYAPNSATQVKTSNELTFMSFNLQSGFLLSCTNSPSSQIAQMTTADYVGTQETVQGVDTRCNKCNIPKLIADGTGMSSRFLMTIPFRTGQYGINAATSQTILETKTTLFSYGGVEQRGCVAVRTQPPGLGGRNLWFINTHVEFYVWAARQSQVASLISFAQSLVNADPKCIIVVTGDFNGDNGDSMYGTMKNFFKNSWEVFNGSPNGGYTHPADWPSQRFDHIWFRVPSDVTATPTSVTVVNALLSDHRPVRATIKFVVPGSTPAPATKAPTTPAPATKAPTTPAPATPAPATKAPATPAPATKAPATPAPATKAPVTAAPATPAPPPKGATTAPTNGCSVSVSGNANSPVIIKNTGSKPIKSLTVTFTPSLPSNNWNWVSQGNNKYTIPEWAFQTLAISGAEYSSSGYYTAAAAPTATVTSVSC